LIVYTPFTGNLIDPFDCKTADADTGVVEL